MESIDKLVFAEIPDSNADPVAYSAVCSYMMHGPCEKDSTYLLCIWSRHGPCEKDSTYLLCIWSRINVLNIFQKGISTYSSFFNVLYCR